MKTSTKTMIISKYNDKTVVKKFETGILLIGITTTSASSDPNTSHIGLVYYDAYTTDLSKRLSDIRSDHGNYFPILSKNNNDATDRLLSAYNISKPCSITIRLASGSTRLKRSEENNQPPLKSAPANPVTLNVTMYYFETPPLFGV